MISMNKEISPARRTAILSDLEQLKKKDTQAIRTLVAASHRVSDLRGVPKGALIGMILVDRHGRQAVREVVG